MRFKAIVIIDVPDENVDFDFKEVNKTTTMKKSEYTNKLKQSFSEVIKKILSKESMDEIKIEDVKVSVMKGDK